MDSIIQSGAFSGTFRIPASKSHSIRRLLIAALAEGESIIDFPLDSLDVASCVSVCRALGASIEELRGEDSASPNQADAQGRKLLRLTVHGPLDLTKQNSHGPILCDVGNSGTTLFLALATASLFPRAVTFDGDAQIRRRSARPLLQALEGLGVRTSSADGGCAPITVQGPWKGGRVSIECPTSQYLSALLLSAPCAERGVVTEIAVPLLNEKPYITLTLSYLNAGGITYDMRDDYSFFRIPGGQAWRSLSGSVASDFSSAAFPAAAAALSGGRVRLLGLDPEDSQGDKVFFEYLSRMGCSVAWDRDEGGDYCCSVEAPDHLKGGIFDLNATPDLLPIMAVLASYARGKTELIHVASARIKETDRISTMARELSKLGVQCEELPDGLIIQGGGITKPGEKVILDGHGDHRVVMALAAAARGTGFPVTITGSEAADVTYPLFMKMISENYTGKKP